MELSVERWEALSSTERETLAQRLTGELPAGFAFKAGLRLNFAYLCVLLFKNRNCKTSQPVE